MRMLLVEAAQSVTRLDEGFRKQYAARCHHKAKGVAKVAAATIGSATLLDAAYRSWLSRDRPYREQPAGAPGRHLQRSWLAFTGLARRRKPDRRIDWALSHPAIGWMSD
jgi:hypothetical protein